MEYIPNSTIVKQDELSCTKQLNLPDDIINLVLDFDILLLDPSDDDFWIKLGMESCNLRRWCNNCFYILQPSFGKTNKYSKLFTVLETLFITLCSKLDDFVCDYYPLNKHNIYINDELTYKINNKANIKLKENKFPITNIFYNSDTIPKYPTKYDYTGYKRTLTNDDKQYILTFVTRLDKYLNYLETIVDKIPIKNNSTYNWKPVKDTIIKTIEKMKKKCDKMNILNDITVKERIIS